MMYYHAVERKEGKITLNQTRKQVSEYLPLRSSSYYYDFLHHYCLQRWASYACCYKSPNQLE